MQGVVAGRQAESRPAYTQEQSVSATIATPSTTDTVMKPPMFQVSAAWMAGHCRCKG